MREQAQVNKKAWEYRAFEFWNMNYGEPAERAAQIKKAPLARFHLHRPLFENVTGKKIANPCGSNGRMAVPLAVLGNDVTVFDISGENQRYALALAREAGVNLDYVLGDFCETDLAAHGDAYDIVYAEGGILHYFSDIGAFADTLYAITKPGGQLILSDFHPYRKVNPTGSPMMSVPQTGGDYFDTRLHSVNVAYQNFFPEREQGDFPKCLCRHHTMSEIINAVIAAGFALREFQEHPSYDDKRLPGLFTLIAAKP